MTALSARRPLWLGFATLGLVVAGLGLWGTLAPLAGVLRLSGQVDVAQDHQILQHPEGGVVADIAVAEGDRVTQGQVLLRLDGTALMAERSALTAGLDDLAARRARLEAERDGAAAPQLPAGLPADLAADQLRRFELRRAIHLRTLGETDQRLAQTARQISGIDAQLAALRDQHALVAQDLAVQKTLRDKGLAPASRILSLEREIARLLGETGRLRAARAEAEALAGELRLARSRLGDQRRETALAELGEVTRAQSDLAARRTALDDRIARLALRAPADGIVLNLQIGTRGAVIRPAEPLLALVAQDRPLVVSARLPPRLIAQVRTGQAARLLLPQRDTDPIPGRVGLISADVLPAEPGQPPGYRIEIWPDPGAPAARHLRPGLPIEIRLEDSARTAFDLLAGPLTDPLARAFEDG